MTRFCTPVRQRGKKEGAAGSINIKEVESKGRGDKLYVREVEGGLKEDTQVSAPRWGRRPGSRHRWHRTMPREGRSCACVFMASRPRRKQSSSQDRRLGGSQRRTPIGWLGSHAHCCGLSGWIYYIKKDEKVSRKVENNNCHRFTGVES